jgi:UDP-N-acetylglucosamine 2-epimerase (non-hydrolysing)
MIFAVVGTRPEVIKMAPVLAALRQLGVPTRLVATGQHHDWQMMGSFLSSYQLHVDHTLQLGTHSLLGSFVKILGGLGELFEQERPQLVLAVGDTTTVIGAAFAARKSGIAFGHVESGLRAFSRELPEEEHRICADALADLLFAPTEVAVENLRIERVNGAVYLTGNPILDALRTHMPTPVAPADRRGVLVTIHRQETVDDPQVLRQVMAAIAEIGCDHDVEWPIHPRTRARASEFGLSFPATVRTSPPLPHGEFLQRLASARLVITDSGGVQEESAILGTPCVTVRKNTERVETLHAGVGLLAGVETSGLIEASRRIFADWESFARPVPHLYGDGRAGYKIAALCSEWLALTYLRPAAAPNIVPRLDRAAG